MIVRRWKVLFLVASLALSACSNKTAETTSEAGVSRKPACVQFGITQNRGFQELTDGPVSANGDVRYDHVTVSCDTKIVPVDKPLPISEWRNEDVYELVDDKGMGDGWVSGPLLPHPAEVKWVKRDEPVTKASEWYVVPAQTFQCKLKPVKFMCTGSIKYGFELTTYSESAYEVTGQAAIKVPVVSLDIAHTERQSEKEKKPLSVGDAKDATWSQIYPSFWTGLLFNKVKYVHEGLADLCYGPHESCLRAHVQVTEVDDILVSTAVFPWDALMNNFAQTMGRVGVDVSSYVPGLEPNVREYARATWETNDPSTPTSIRPQIGPGIDGFSINWAKKHSFLQQQDTTNKATLKASVWKVDGSGSASSSSSQGTEVLTESSVTVQYKAPTTGGDASFRCFRVFKVGENGQTPISGFILEEGEVGC